MTLALFMTGIFTISGIVAILSTETGMRIGPEVGSRSCLPFECCCTASRLWTLSAKADQGTLREVNRLFTPEPLFLTTVAKHLLNLKGFREREMSRSRLRTERCHNKASIEISYFPFLL